MLCPKTGGVFVALTGTKKRVRVRMRKKFLEVYKEQRCNASETRQILGLGHHTFSRWMKKYPKFEAAVLAIEEAMVDDVVVVLADNALAGKQRAIEFFLLNHRRTKYRNTQRNELTGADGGPVTYMEKVYEDPKSTEPLPHQVGMDKVEEKKDE
jgi:hypothetical protein